MFWVDSREVLSEPFEIADNVIIPVGDYRFERYGIGVETGGQRKLALNLSFEGGDFFGGDRSTISTGFTWQPSMHFNGSVEYVYNEIDLPEGIFDTRLLRIESDVAFNSEWA